MAETTPSDITSVYLVLRKDFDHHTDRKGRLAAPIGAYRTPAAANAAARAHCEAQARRAPDYGEEPEHDEVAGMYAGRCYTREDRRDHFEVSVKPMKLLGDETSKAKKRKSDVLDGGGSSSSSSARGAKSARPDDASATQVVVLD